MTNKDKAIKLAVITYGVTLAVTIVGFLLHAIEKPEGK